MVHRRLSWQAFEVRGSKGSLEQRYLCILARFSHSSHEALAPQTKVAGPDHLSTSGIFGQHGAVYWYFKDHCTGFTARAASLPSMLGLLRTRMPPEDETVSALPVEP